LTGDAGWRSVRPLVETVPTPVGVSDHVTFVALVVNCCVPPMLRDAVCGVTDIVEIRKVAVAVPDCELSAVLVAVIVTLVLSRIVAGAVYSPVEEIVPVPAGVADQVTPVVSAFVTVAVYCWVPFADNVVVDGPTVTVTGSRVMVAVAL